MTSCRVSFFAERMQNAKTCERRKKQNVVQRPLETVLVNALTTGKYSPAASLISYVGFLLERYERINVFRMRAIHCHVATGQSDARGPERAANDAYFAENGAGGRRQRGPDVPVEGKGRSRCSGKLPQQASAQVIISEFCIFYPGRPSCLIRLYLASQVWLPPLGLSLDIKNQRAAAPTPITKIAISMIDFLLQD